MKQVTITITPTQAAKIVSLLQQGQDIALNFRQSVKHGQQKGGMWGMLAKLAAPIATGLLGGVASYGANKVMQKLSGGGCTQGPCVTCTKRQMHVLQSGAGQPLMINFKISRSNKHRRPGMMGAGMMDTMMSNLPSLFATALGKAAPKVAESAGNAAGGYISGKVNKYFSGTKKPAVVASKKAVKPAYIPDPFAGSGIRLAGRGQQYGDGWFDDVISEASSSISDIGQQAVSVGRQVGKKASPIVQKIGRTAQKKNWISAQCSKYARTPMGHEEPYMNRLYSDVLERINKMVGHNGTTTSDELDRVGKKLFGKSWMGSVPRDMFPKMNDGDVCIVNTHTSRGSGEHWLALARSRDELLGYDSFGRQLGMGIRDSDLDAEQQKIEKNCGQRCLAWLCIFKEFGHKCLLI